jgi:hypothetical protein
MSLEAGFGCGIILRAQAHQAYVMDSFTTEYIASASAASQLMCMLAAFSFPFLRRSHIQVWDMDRETVCWRFWLWEDVCPGLLYSGNGVLS